MPDPEPARDLPGGVRALVAAYGLAHGGKTLFWAASDLCFTFYMNETCGIPPAISGLVVGGSILVAALADLLTGRLFGAIVRDARTAGRAQCAGAIASTVALLLFAGAAWVPPGLRVAACIVTLLGFRFAYAMLDVPQNALLSLAGGGERGRTTLVAMRNVTGGLARLCLAAAFVPVMGVQPPLAAVSRFFGLVIAMAAIVVPGAFLLAVLLRRFAAPPQAQPAIDDTEAPRLRRRMAIASALTTSVLQLEPYLATHTLTVAGAGTAFLVALALGSVVAQPIARLVPRAELWRWVFAMLVLSALAFAALPAFGMGGAILLGVVYGMASGGLLFTLWTEIARSAPASAVFDAHARFTAVAKLGQGLAIIAIGGLLQGLRADAVAGQVGAISPLWISGLLGLGTLLLLALPSAKTVDVAPQLT